MSSKSKARRTSHQAKVRARSAYVSGVTRCYVVSKELHDGTREDQLCEKTTGRTVRILSGDRRLQGIVPLTNLLRDCQGHGRGLTDRWSRKEYIAVTAPVIAQDGNDISLGLDDTFTLKVHIATADMLTPPTSVWCYIEEYVGETSDTLGLRLREKESGRKVEMYGTNKMHLTKFLASPRFTGTMDEMPNLFEKDGFRDYVLVSGGTAVDSYDVLLFQDDADLTYLLGPSPDTAYRDAFSMLTSESATISHTRTARTHFEKGYYREAILAARLAVETRCGGRSTHVKPRLSNAPQEVKDAGAALYDKRNLAVHEGDTRVEQTDAAQALNAMTTVLDYLRADEERD
ncbi:hypothetical protein ACNPNP_00110 [Microbacterium sp. AGC85]